jgi:hypothetical protein
MMTFSWPERLRSSWTLAALIFASLALHSVPFFFIQAATPKLGTPPRTAPAILYISPYDPDGTFSSENIALLHWIETNDPALVARAANVEPPGLFDIEYRPSFATVRTPPLGVPSEPSTVQFPAARDPLALIMSATPRSATPEPRVEPRATVVHFPSTLAARLPEGVKFSPRGKIKKAIEPTRFLVGVSPEGEARFIFRQEPRGDTGLDAEAEDFIASVKFTPGANEAEWGIVTIDWGDEINQ